MNNEKAGVDSAPVIKFADVNLAYDGKTVFENFSLEIERGAKVVFLGKSGWGKTSLLALILGFITPDSGNVFFESHPVDNKSVWDVRKKVAYVDQDVSISNENVSDWLGFVFSLKANCSVGFDRNKFKALLDFFDLEIDVLEKNISELSGGQRQRLAVIIAVLLGREVFILDEVISSLDKHLKKKVVDYFVEHDLWTVVAVSHDPVWLNNSGVKVFDLEVGKWRQ